MDPMLINARIAFFTFLVFTFYSAAQADDVINDDLIVTQSLCAGIECMNGEQFEFDTLRLKSDDPQIRFHDTSTSAMFPTNDWVVGITDNGAGGAATFFITDVETGNAVLQLQAQTDGGIAIGAGAEVVSNAVSFGAAGAERKISHVAEGTDDSDGVNKAQFDTFAAQIDQTIVDKEAALDAQIIDLQNRLDEINDRITDLTSRVDAL